MMILRRDRLLSEMPRVILALDGVALVGVAVVAGGGAVAVGGDVAAVVPVVVAGQLPVRQLRLQQSCGRGGLPHPL